MGTKEKTTIYINGDIKKRAVDLGLNLSQVCENALGIAAGSLSTAYRLLKVNSEPGRQGPQAAEVTPLAYRPVEPVAGVQIPPSAHTLPQFRRFLEVDLQRKRLTVNGHAQNIARLLEWLGDRPVTKDVLRDYLDLFRDKDPNTYANQLKSLKVFFRDYMAKPDLVATFKFPGKEVDLKRIPEKPKLQKFYAALLVLDLRAACYFLLYATSGWRRREVMALNREDADIEARILMPRLKTSTTKGRLPGFFNEEAQDILRKYLAARKDASPKLIPMTERTFRMIWNQAAEACGFTIQPQLLRDWFCEEMGNLGVSDRYIDAFCGRVPKSVLAKHYTDYAPEKLKPIYDRAGLKVLS